MAYLRAPERAGFRKSHEMQQMRAIGAPNLIIGLRPDSNDLIQPDSAVPVLVLRTTSHASARLLQLGLRFPVAWRDVLPLRSCMIGVSSFRCRSVRAAWQKAS